MGLSQTATAPGTPGAVGQMQPLPVNPGIDQMPQNYPFGMSGLETMQAGGSFNPYQQLAGALSNIPNPGGTGIVDPTTAGMTFATPVGGPGITPQSFGQTGSAGGVATPPWGMQQSAQTGMPFRGQVGSAGGIPGQVGQPMPMRQFQNWNSPNWLRAMQQGIPGLIGY